MGGTDGVVKSAGRVMRILEVFDERQCPLSISDLVNTLGYPQSSVSALMKSLYSLGFMDYDARARLYRPALRIALLGQWLLRESEEIGPLPELADSLAEKMGDTVIIGALNGINVTYIHVLNSEHTLRFHLAVGTSRPIFQSGMGYVLIADLPDEEIGRMVRRHNYETENQRHRVDLGEVAERIAFVRENNYFVSRNLATKGAGIAAVRLPTRGMNRPTAIGIGAPVDRLDQYETDYIRVLREAIISLREPRPRPTMHLHNLPRPVEVRAS